MLNPTELRNGTVYTEDGSTYRVMKYEHIKKGRGRATIRVKVKDIVKGNTLDKTYTDGDSLKEADVQKRNSQYMYKDDESLYFMDNSDFSQFSFAVSEYEWESKFLKDGSIVMTVFLEGDPVSFELQPSVDLEVLFTDELATAGDTATGAMKNAETDTGFLAKVPLFVKIGDKIRVRTEDGEYLGKA